MASAQLRPSESDARPVDSDVRRTVRELGGHDQPLPRIVVGVDGSADSRRALRWAVDEGRLRGAVVEAVHAWQTPYLGAVPLVAEFIDPVRYEQAAQRLAEREARSVCQAGLPKPIEPIVVRGSPTAVLTDAAAGAELLVVGGRGLGAVTRMLLGSVSDRLSDNAPCPITIVRPETTRRTS